MRAQPAAIAAKANTPTTIPAIVPLDRAGLEFCVLMGEAIDVDDAFGNELVVELELVVVDV